MGDNKFIVELRKQFKDRLYKYGASEYKEKELKERFERIIQLLKFHNRFEYLDSDIPEDWCIRCSPKGYKESLVMGIDTILEYVFSLEYTDTKFIQTMLNFEDVEIGGRREGFAIFVNGKGYVQSKNFEKIWEKYCDKYWSKIENKAKKR